MSKIKEILRLYTTKTGVKTIAKRTGVARNTVRKYIQKFHELKIEYQELRALSDVDLSRVFGRDVISPPTAPGRLEDLFSFFPHVEKELKRTGVSLQMMWEEYHRKHPDGYLRSRFGDYFREWCKRSEASMHINHKAGDKLFIDFTGKKLPIVDRETGEVIEVEVFVTILPASQLIYCQATETQQKYDFITALENALHFYGGVPQALTTDNLKAAVIKADRYEPTLNETMADFAEHYGTFALPTRAYKPKDKALVEGAVKIIYSNVHAMFRNTVFTSIEELNEAILVRLEVLNSRRLTGRPFSRQQLFNELEKEKLAPLPPLKYAMKQQTFVTVAKTGHVCLRPDNHYYSVPYQLMGKKVKLLFSKTQVDIYLDYDLVASHVRDKCPGAYTSKVEHLASAHQFTEDWTPEKFIERAAVVGSDVKMVIEKVLKKRQHPEQGYKSCQGILAFKTKVGSERLNNACRRALQFDHCGYLAIKGILENGLDQFAEEEVSTQLKMPLHDNIRGEDYYQ